MLIHSDERLQSMFQSVFSTPTYQASLFSTARDGLKAASTDATDLIFIQSETSGISVANFVNLLRSAENTKMIPVVVLAEARDDAKRQSALKDGVADFIYHPYHAVDIRNKAEKLLARGTIAVSNRPSRVMAVEDSPIVCRVYKRIFDKCGYNFLLVQDSTKAIEQIRMFRPDLILMDQNMPEISGIELTQQLKTDPELKDIRVVMVTGDRKRESTLTALEIGVTDFITKPFDEEVLIARMRNHLTAKRMYDNLQDAFVELSELKDRLELLSITDGLTGLFNHRHFYETIVYQMELAAKSKQPLSVMIFDIDHFKKFNDTYGHKAGDLVLMTVAAAVGQVKRNNDMAARYGGEEFAIIMPETNLEEAVLVAEHVRKQIESAKTFHENHQLNVTVSLGVALWNGQETESDVIKRADKAMYKSKNEGRNRVNF